jgi:hypothetical protein
MLAGGPRLPPPRTGACSVLVLTRQSSFHCHPVPLPRAAAFTGAVIPHPAPHLWAPPVQGATVIQGSSYTDPLVPLHPPRGLFMG